MKSISKDARGFVEGIVSHLKRSGKAKQVSPKVQSLLLKMTANARKERVARVESAVKLSAQELQSLTDTLSRVAGHDITLESGIRPELVGGFRITMGDLVVDMSIAHEIAEMTRIVHST